MSFELTNILLQTSKGEKTGEFAQKLNCAFTLGIFDSCKGSSLANTLRDMTRMKGNKICVCRFAWLPMEKLFKSNETMPVVTVFFSNSNVIRTHKYFIANFAEL